MRDVNVWTVLWEDSIDRKLESMIREKSDAAELVLDGHLLGEDPEEVNLDALLRIAEAEFAVLLAANGKSVTVDERELAKEWLALRAQLAIAARLWLTLKTVLPNTPMAVAAEPILTLPAPEPTPIGQLFADRGAVSS